MRSALRCTSKRAQRMSVSTTERIHDAPSASTPMAIQMRGSVDESSAGAASATRPTHSVTRSVAASTTCPNT